jgi:hypothetical protein
MEMEEVIVEIDVAEEIPSSIQRSTMSQACVTTRSRHSGGRIERILIESYSRIKTFSSMSSLT